MKNLKKVLALVLVVATLMGFATVASAQYTDDASIDYKEAVEVMSAINVINGYTDGSFRPEGNVTRAQMAKMVAYIVAGGEDVGALYASANTFTDCTSHWAKGYIAYASMTGFVAGVGNNKFNPEGSVTGVQAAKMLLCALGYDATVEQYVGTSWAVNTLADAKAAGLLDGLGNIDMGKALSREAAAQMMLNALQADMVEYETKGSTITINGIEFAQGASAAKAVTSTEDWAANISDDDVEGAATKDDPYTVQLGEKYFSKLEYLSAGTTDDFGRPAHKWVYDDEDVGTYANTAKFTYTADLDPEDLPKEWKNYTVSDSLKPVSNGTEAASALAKDDDAAKKAIAGLADNGTVVELFVSGKEITNVVVIKASFGEVAVKENAETKTRGARTAYTLDNKAYYDYTTVVDADNDKDTAFVTGDVKDGDMVVYYVVKGNAYISSVGTVSGALTAISSKGEYTIDGQKYSMSAAAGAVAPSLNKDSADYYVDSYGYLLGAVKETTSTTYALVLEADEEYTLSDKNTMVKSFYAIVAKGDGTVEKLTTDALYTAGKLYTIGKTTDGETALGAVSGAKVDANATAITNKSFNLTGSDYKVTANTLFVFTDYKDSKGDRVPAGTVTTYTGMNNVASISTDGVKDGKIYAVDTSDTADKIAEIVFVFGDVKGAVSDEYVYVKGTYSNTSDGYVYDVIIKGEETTMTLSQANVGEGMYKSIKDTGSTVTATKAPATETYTKAVYNGGLLNLTPKSGSAFTKTIADDVDVYFIDTYDNTVTTAAANTLDGEITLTEAYAVIDGDAVTALYVVFDSSK